MKNDSLLTWFSALKMQYFINARRVMRDIDKGLYTQGTAKHSEISLPEIHKAYINLAMESMWNHIENRKSDFDKEYHFIDC